jgi:hypothetical protein
MSDLTLNEIILIIIAVLGGLGIIVQFILNRIHKKNDRLIEQKHEAYSGYMKKSDEIMNHVRKDPKMILNIFGDLFKEIYLSKPEEMSETLIKINEKIFDSVNDAIEPQMILKQELNALLIICSNELREKLNELITLTTDYNNEMQKCLSVISTNDSNSLIREFQTLGHNNRWLRVETLNKEIVDMMREEIGSNKKRGKQ